MYASLAPFLAPNSDLASGVGRVNVIATTDVAGGPRGVGRSGRGPERQRPAADLCARPERPRRCSSVLEDTPRAARRAADRRGRPRPRARTASLGLRVTCPHGHPFLSSPSRRPTPSFAGSSLGHRVTCPRGHPFSARRVAVRHRRPHRRPRTPGGLSSRTSLSQLAGSPSDTVVRSVVPRPPDLSSRTSRTQIAEPPSDTVARSVVPDAFKPANTGLKPPRHDRRRAGLLSPADAGAEAPAPRSPWGGLSSPADAGAKATARENRRGGYTKHARHADRGRVRAEDVRGIGEVAEQPPTGISQQSGAQAVQGAREAWTERKRARDEPSGQRQRGKGREDRRRPKQIRQT